MTRSGYALAAALFALSLATSGCVGVQSDPLPGGGYVSYPIVRPRESVPLGEYPTPTVESITPFPTMPPCMGVVTADPRLNVRAEPGGAVVGSVGLGVQVEVIGSEAGWLQIAAPPGWVWGEFVRASC